MRSPSHIARLALLAAALPALACAQAADVPIAGGWLVNADVNKVQIETDVRAAGTKVGTFKVDPWLFSPGVGRRF